MKFKRTILVTGAGSFCAINIIKSLKCTNKYKIITTDIFPHSVGVFCSDKGFLVPKESEDGKYIDNLLRICKKEKVELLIPGFDSEIPYIYSAKNDFEALGTKVLIGNKLLNEIGWDKYKLSLFLKNNQFPYLKSFEIIEKDRALNELTFPIVLKPKSGWGQRGFKMINNIHEYDFYINNIKDPRNFMIQEYIDDNEGEFTNSVSVALDGDILGCICMKRELVKGNSRLITVDDFPELKKQMIAIAQLISSPGPINLQCRLKNGIAHVFEINPRFSTTNSVRTASGYNEVELLVDHFITGKKKYITHYKKLRAMAYLNYVFVDSQSVNQFISKKSTDSKAKIENML